MERYQIGFDGLHADSGFKSRMEKMMQDMCEQPVSTPKAPRAVRRRALLVVLAAVLLLFAACAAICFSTVSRLKSEAERRANRTEAEVRQEAAGHAEFYTEGHAPTLAVDSAVTLGDVTFAVRALELLPAADGKQELYLKLSFESETTAAIGNFDWLSEDVRAQRLLKTCDSVCELGMDARDFTLWIGGVPQTPYMQADYEGLPSPAAGYNDADGLFSMSFRELSQPVSSGTELTLTGTLYRCDKSGVRTEPIGAFSLPFTYRFTEADRAAWADALTTEFMERQQTAAEARADALSTLPEAATPIQTTVEEVTLLDIAADAEGFLLGLRYDLTRELVSREQMFDCFIDGYKVDSSEVDGHWDRSDAKEETARPRYETRQRPCAYMLLERIPYYRTRETMPEVVTIVLKRPGGVSTDPFTPTLQYAYPAAAFAFRYHLATGAVTLPKTDAEKAEWLATANRHRDECRIYGIAGQSETQNGVDVAMLRLAALSDGRWILLFKLENVASEVVATELAPSITVEGQGVQLLTEFYQPNAERIREILNNYSMEKTRWTVCEWTFRPPARIDQMPETFVIEIAWDAYDLTKAGERERIGTFSFRIPLDREDYTTAVDQAYYRDLEAD